MKQPVVWAGIDVGSTTVKVVLVEPDSKKILHHRYARHNARQAETLLSLLQEIDGLFPGILVNATVCGSGGKNLAEAIQAHYIQEVVANSIAIKDFFPQTRVAVELGGQDAKIIFFHYDEASGQLMASDMRMNGSCAGGTGAFIDEIASLLKVPVSDFNALASKGRHIYDISGRCGVFAKTDIQPLLNQGVSREDIALSTYHAIAKQTIGGLAQGLEIKAPVIFEGGPLTFNPRLVEVFAERLGLGPDDIMRPENPEIIVALGTALSTGVMFGHEANAFDLKLALDRLAHYTQSRQDEDQLTGRAFFDSEAEKADFFARHQLPTITVPNWPAGSRIPVYLGIDAGSTTTKFVLMTEDEQLVDSYYAHNDGEPLRVIQRALVALNRRYQESDWHLKILGVGVTGYGELLFSKALHADYHVVETVAHAKATMKYIPDVSFILDIGGQDMKAIQITNNIVTGITLNEACSAGCGSFLENFASSLKVPVKQISDTAFAAKDPSVLGSRCTVFMNSCIITEQKNGKTPQDIIAGLCRSIIDNVFTKVVRIANLTSLGDRIVVQGGTFKNMAVLRAIEQYTGKQVVRSPYPGEMGALGIALLTKQHLKDRPAAEANQASTFIGFPALEELSFTQQPNVICPFCTNNCNRTVITFSSGDNFITGNRCERGEILGQATDSAVREQVKAARQRIDAVPDLFKYRQELLFRDWPCVSVLPDRKATVGIPRVLEFWNSFPFWNNLFRALGFTVRLSGTSTQRLYEDGIHAVSSDTVCFPAKLVHGHIADLVKKKVDRIFMPIMNRMPSENADRNSTYVCAVVKGYPMVVRISDDPMGKHGIPFDTPNFHWLDTRSRNLQLVDYLKKTIGISAASAKAAIAQADLAMDGFQRELLDKGRELLDSLKLDNSLAVVLAGRPYHNDNFINHDLAGYFTRQGIPVLPLDAIPGVHRPTLKTTRLDVNNNFHTRVLNAAVAVGNNPNLEMVQIVSFGCGHDAILSDEMTRILKDIAGKSPLILKLDESNTAGSLNIRTKSFIETLHQKRTLLKQAPAQAQPDPYAVKFEKKHRKEKTILIPNLSPTFSAFATSILRRQGLRVERLPLADGDAFKLGKKYVHNDICFPAQVNIGEFLAVMDKGLYKPDEVAFGIGKGICDCRYTQYAVLARKALDDAGYKNVPLMSTDKDTKGMHPGLELGELFQLRMIWALCIADALEALSHRVRPYELEKGATEKVFDESVAAVAAGFERGVKYAIAAFKACIPRFDAIPVDMREEKPKVFIIGEILLNFHPSSNNFIVRYLEDHGMEVILPYMVNKFRMEYIRAKDEMKNFHVRYPFAEALTPIVGDALIKRSLRAVAKIARSCRYFREEKLLEEYAPGCEHLVHKTFVPGEGWMIAGEITELAKHGINYFIILQPFGCMPNHITGRGMSKGLKKDFPHIQILALDYDPDTSQGNIENRLQMLIINAYERQKNLKAVAVAKAKATAGGGAAGAPACADPAEESAAGAQA
ncbi:MAG TPA: activase [Spirochaetaceae bacterium]|nr:activase [Spirochaetaceae bacterium]HAX37152.1 activase [Spirochaetaceae bacterium]HBO40749.1 activase [Spirochaetaceae bacterium]HCQ88204.1 activase [Spirochaetaceae bacterium]